MDTIDLTSDGLNPPSCDFGIQCMELVHGRPLLQHGSLNIDVRSSLAKSLQIAWRDIMVPVENQSFKSFQVCERHQAIACNIGS